MPIRRIQLQRGSLPPDARIVDEDVEWTNRVLDGRDELGEPGSVGEIERQERHFRWKIVWSLPRDGRHPDTLFQEALDDSPADPVRTPGDESSAILQVQVRHRESLASCVKRQGADPCRHCVNCLWGSSLPLMIPGLCMICPT